MACVKRPVIAPSNSSKAVLAVTSFWFWFESISVIKRFAVCDIFKPPLKYFQLENHGQPVPIAEKRAQILLLVQIQNLLFVAPTCTFDVAVLDLSMHQ